VSPATGWIFTSGRFAGTAGDQVAGFHPSNDSVWTGTLAGSQFVFALWGYTSEGPWVLTATQAGDFNHDGRTDLLGYATSGELIVGLSDGASFTFFRWGAVPAPGDWRLAVGTVTGLAQPDVIAYEKRNPGCGLGAELLLPFGALRARRRTRLG